MKKLKRVLAISWAFCCTLLILFIVIRMPQFTDKASGLGFMKTNPIYTGGDLNYTVKKDSLEIAINKPVFEALFGSPEKGFVQVKFSGVKKIPSFIDEEIDYNNDSVADFRVKINKKENHTEFLSLNPDVTSLLVSSKVKNDWIIRVKVMNKH